MSSIKQNLAAIQSAARREGEVIAFEDIVKELRKEAGEAFASGDDELALTLRSQAEKADKKLDRKRAQHEKDQQKADTIIQALEAEPAKAANDGENDNAEGNAGGHPATNGSQQSGAHPEQTSLPN